MTGADFKRRRNVLGWTQKETAEALAVTIAQISAIENGRSSVTPTIQLLFSLYRPFDRPRHPTGTGPQDR